MRPTSVRYSIYGLPAMKRKLRRDILMAVGILVGIAVLLSLIAILFD
jgi:hypothetical protein